ncbi:MAG: hypothetical protein E7067_08560 [Lentimicrobiaceae bacterium]|nr:hypothetical protein [Lentimicrobiaceae bacterium]
MSTQLKTSMRPTASFNLKNVSSESVRVCLFPGHFDTSEVVAVSDGDLTKVVLAYSNPEAINAAGFSCAQVADDYNINTKSVYRGSADGNGYAVQITPVSKRTRYRDFLNYIRYANLSVVKIRITDLEANSDHAIFNQELEVSASAIGAKAGSDFIQLSAHRNPAHYDQSFIEIDLSQQNLLLNETTLASLDIPANANIQIDFTLG